MASKNVSLNWNPETKFTARNKNNVMIRMNQQDAIGASDMLPISLIGCSSYDVVEILGKQKQDLRELNVTAEATQDDDPPWRFRKVHIHYQAVGKGLDVERVRKAIMLSEEKYCSVYATLRDAIEITHDVEVVEG
ncbi:MAG: OsmC family protein [Anaerolineales bacterium]|nr:OsmC family protein [Anaerolineales bacterium]MBP6211307.1 OsmC family protein [Anaerolineales bacterium]